jgi:predicted Fe-S protein YdhL (DUF1289 family)
MNEPAFSSSAATIDSPCLGVCVIDARIAACYGCFRTIAEISAWPAATQTEKRAIATAMEERRRKAISPKRP